MSIVLSRHLLSLASTAPQLNNCGGAATGSTIAVYLSVYLSVCLSAYLIISNLYYTVLSDLSGSLFLSYLYNLWNTLVTTVTTFPSFSFNDFHAMTLNFTWLIRSVDGHFILKTRKPQIHITLHNPTGQQSWQVSYHFPFLWYRNQVAPPVTTRPSAASESTSAHDPTHLR